MTGALAQPIPTDSRWARSFLEVETTAIENVAVRRIRRAYRKKHPSWREEWDRVLRAEERRAATKIMT
jgi:hypothetical protein